MIKEDILKDPMGVARLFIEELLERSKQHERLFKIPKPEGLLRKDASGHFHTTPELFLQLSGRMHFTFPFEAFDLAAGQICLVPTGMPHDECIIKTTEPFLVSVISIFSQNLSVHIASGDADCHPRCITGDTILSSRSIRGFVSYLDDMVDIKHSRRKGREHCLAGMSELILGSLLEMLDEPVASDRSNLKITRCQRYIERDFSNPLLNVKFLAAKVQCAPDYLSHLFHKETGQNLNSLITLRRINHAYVLLQNSALNISEVALHCGFDDPGYFTRVFKKNSGVTPRQYRRRNATSRSYT